MLRNQLLLATLASSLWLAAGCLPQPTGKPRTPPAKKETKSAPLPKPAEAAPSQPTDNKAEGPQVPADVQYVPDLTYCTIGTTRLLLDVAYPKKSNGPFPTVVLLHGGGWYLGGRKVLVRQTTSPSLIRHQPAGRRIEGLRLHALLS